MKVGSPIVHFRHWHRPRVSVAIGLIGVLCAASAVLAQPATPTAIQAKRFALRVRLAENSAEASRLTLWYTRDRGETWHQGKTAPAGQDRIVFDANGEGLYGFYVVAHGAEGASSPEPTAGTLPQRWVYVDYTPPLAQWKNVEVLTDKDKARRVALDWVAHDANLDTRPIALSYQIAGQAQWHTIDNALPNTGQFDWQPPEDCEGRVIFKLSVRDLGGHLIERLFGPISLSSPRLVVAPEPPASQPAAEMEAVQASPEAPAGPELVGPIDPASRARAQRLYEQGLWHAERFQFADAEERFREAIELDPTLLAARTNLAGALSGQGRFAEAVKEYRQVLQDHPDRPTALRGAAMAYSARREYASAREMLERLLLREETNAQAWLDLGDVLYQMGQLPGARANWRRAASVDPTATEVIRIAQNRLSLFPLTAATAAPQEGK
ncbi:MAG: tetratricopeptide repeat protein [Phycisphaerae bacterium]|nr:tetratricopeptide repeat protein [Phycisphaerae bacterium]